MFKALLISLTAAIAIYTFFAIQNEGLNLFAVLFSNILAMGWSGQFNLDFASYLLLSALWVMWRGGFSASSIAMGMAAAVLGILFFAPYLLYLMATANGNIRQVILGKN